MPPKLLFVCGKNKLRSPTAESIFADEYSWNTRSFGVNNDSEIQMNAEDIEWADYIFVMEAKHRKKIQNAFPKCLKNKKLICLNIPDNYDYMDDDLVDILKTKVPPLIKSGTNTPAFR